MPLGDYLIGVVLFSVVFGSAALGARILLKRIAPDLRGAEAVVAFGILLIGALLFIHLAPATIGLLARGSVVLASLLWLAACLAVRPREVPHPPLALPESSYASPSFTWTKPASVIAIALIAIFYLAFVLDQATTASGSIDFGTFHLPNVIRWIQTGSIWQIDNFLPGASLGSYPNNGDVLLLAFVLPWHNDFLVHAATWLLYPLTGLSVYALARRMGALVSVAVIAASLVLAIPSVAIPALPNSMTDTLALFGFTGGVLFLTRHASTDRRTDLLLAGLALGVCLGTKWYSLTTVAIVAVVWLAARVVARQAVRSIGRDVAWLTGAIGISGGLWFVRNWVELGNPLFPVRVELFGVTIFDAPTDEIREAAGFTILDYVGDWDVWWRVDLWAGANQVDGILPQWIDALAGPAILVGLGAVMTATVLRAPRANAVVFSVLASTALLAMAYSVTPYTAGGPPGIPLLVGADSRYVVPALIAAAVTLAVGAGMRRAIEITLVLGCLPAVSHGLLSSGGGGLSPATLSVGDWFFGVAALAIVLGLAALVWRARPIKRSALVSGVALLALLLVVGGHVIQEQFNETRYKGPDSVINALGAATETPLRVGLAGLWDEQGLSPSSAFVWTSL